MIFLPRCRNGKSTFSYNYSCVKGVTLGKDGKVIASKDLSGGDTAVQDCFHIPTLFKSQASCEASGAQVGHQEVFINILEFLSLHFEYKG